MNDTLKRDQFKIHFKALYASQNPGKLHPGEPQNREHYSTAIPNTRKSSFPGIHENVVSLVSNDIIATPAKQGAVQFHFFKHVSLSKADSHINK